MSNVPDCVFPSSCPEGIPSLDISLQGDVLDYPAQWGKFARSREMAIHTITFWEDDYRFNALGTAVEHGHHWRKLWERPAKVWESGAPSFIEVNFSTSNSQPYYRALWQIAKKRHLSCLFQKMGGMRCWGSPCAVSCECVGGGDGCGQGRLDISESVGKYQGTAVKGRIQRLHVQQKINGVCARHCGCRHVGLVL